MRVLTASDRAVLVECADLDEAMRMHRAWADVPGVIERVPGARTVLVRFDPLVTSAAELASALSATRADQVQLVAGPEVVVPVRYDGDDLADTARLLGVSVDELVRRHGAAHWTVAFSGFAPGFGYLVGDDPLFDVPRRPSPRTRVPAGSVALAGRFSGVYPRETPGGWQLIGTTDAVMWDVHRDPPALLVPGARVRFVTADRVAVSAVVSGTSDASAAERSVGVRHADAGPNGPASPAPALEALNPGLQLLVQDRGRPGLAALGVPASGAADQIAMRDANRAVGNAPEAAVLEGVGPSAVRFHGAGVAVITGAEGELAVTGAGGATRRIGHGVPFAVADGDELHIGAPMPEPARYARPARSTRPARENSSSTAASTVASSTSSGSPSRSSLRCPASSRVAHPRNTVPAGCPSSASGPPTPVVETHRSASNSSRAPRASCSAHPAEVGS